MDTVQPFHFLSPGSASSRSSCSTNTAASPRSPSEPPHRTSHPGPLSQAFHAEKVYMAGWLWRQHHNGPRQTWRRTWYYLQCDRLCYVPEPIADPQAVQYIPLDRIPVRPLPRGYNPLVGAQHVHSGTGETDTVYGAPAHAFSVQCGRHTHFLAAATPSEAEEWITAITALWMRCFKHAGRAMMSSRAHVTASWLLEQTQQLAAENMMLCQSTHSLLHSKQQLDHSPAESTVVEDGVCCEVQILTGDAQAAGSAATVCIELFEPGDGASSGLFCLEPVHAGLGPVMQAAISYFQVACTGLREVHSIALVLDSGSSKISWYVEEIMVRTVGEEEWTSFPCFTWLHAGPEERCSVRLYGRLGPSDLQSQGSSWSEGSEFEVAVSDGD